MARPKGSKNKVTLPEEKKLSVQLNLRINSLEAEKLRVLAEREGKAPTEIAREYFLQVLSSVA